MGINYMSKTIYIFFYENNYFNQLHNVCMYIQCILQCRTAKQTGRLSIYKKDGKGSRNEKKVRALQNYIGSYIKTGNDSKNTTFSQKI